VPRKAGKTHLDLRATQQLAASRADGERENGDHLATNITLTFALLQIDDAKEAAIRNGLVSRCFLFEN
jgi:hypothetical protein